MVLLAKDPVKEAGTMRHRLLISALLLSAVACGSGPSLVPDVVGIALDSARSKLEKAGLDVEVKGGGAFGVVVESSWTVCNQSPASGTSAKAVTVYVDRTCGGSAAPALPPASSSGGSSTGSAANAVSSYMSSNFSSTSWYQFITSIKIVGSVVWVETSIYPDSDASEPATGICRGISSYVYSSANSFDLTGVTVRASDGQRLVLRNDISDPC